MKKTVLLLTFIVLLGCFITGCKKDTSTNLTSSVDNTQSIEQTTNLKTENQQSTAVNTNNPIDIKIGEVINIDDVCEFYIDYINITDDVLPPFPASYYTHYEAETGKTYVDICIAYKNLSTSDVIADEVVTGDLKYANKFEYTGGVIIEEDNRSSLTYASITPIAPLTTEYLHYLFEVPQEVANSTEPIEVNLNIGDRDYRINIRESGSSNLSTNNEAQAGAGTAQKISLGETIKSNNAEFYIERAEFTEIAEPNNTDGYYRYFEAENGKTFLDIYLNYKNLSDQAVQADKAVGARLKYDDNYDYAGFSVIEEDNRSRLTKTNIRQIEPLTETYIHYLFEVPKEIENDGKSLEVSFNIDGENYLYKYS